MVSYSYCCTFFYSPCSANHTLETSMILPSPIPVCHTRSFSICRFYLIYGTNVLFSNTVALFKNLIDHTCLPYVNISLRCFIPLLNVHLTFKGCGMGPLLVLVSPCFKETVVVTCKIGSFLCRLDNLLQKNIIFFFENQIWKWRSFEKRAIFDLLFTFF